MGRIVILIHAEDRLDHPPYFVGPLAERWRDAGHDVAVVNDPSAPVDGDLAFVHVDLTVIPDAYLGFARRFPAAINVGVRDISKRAISDRVLQRGSAHRGPVIVKTDLNTGGAREHRLAQLGARFPGFDRAKRALVRRLHWSLSDGLEPMKYPIYDSVDRVPRTVWFNRRFVVEAFRPEMRDGLYCLRTWCFLGDRETNSICYSKHPIVKSANIIGREVVDGVPERIRELRRAFGFDYGKFDYGVVDGEAVLYDANRTPSMGRLKPEQVGPTLDALAPGIDAFVPRPKSVVPVEHWQRAAKLWDQVGPPLRPCGEDVEFLTARVNAWTAEHGRPPRALILGVTPEVYRLPWPAGAQVRALDHTATMIEAIWPGPREAVTCGEWTDPPFDDASFDLVFCDGGLHLMRHPDQHDAFVGALRRVVAHGGLCLFRLFTPPPDDSPREEVSAVIDDLLAGRIANLNLLKFRLWMALHTTRAAGVPLRDVWNAVHDAEPDFDALADRIGWDREHLAAIHTYRDSPNSYHFLTADQARDLFCAGGGFMLAEHHVPSYPMGDQCPWLVLQRHVDGADAP